MTKFQSFVLFGEMRSGSNHLEYILNAFPVIGCHGELFNPELAGMGNAHREKFQGFTPQMRNEDPFGLLEKVRMMEGVNGFRFFHEHDPRILEEVLADPACAKVILSRNPIERYISYKIAVLTDLWRITETAAPPAQYPDVDAQEFEDLMQRWQQFQLKIQRSLQVTGQTAFYIDYEDLGDLDIINGLGAFLGSPDKLESLPKKYVPQNPETLAEKVANFPQMEQSLARLDRFNLTRVPNFEPRRGPAVPSYVAAKGAGLLYMPMRPFDDAGLRDWLAGLGGLETDFTQKTLRQWRKTHPQHRSFTVLRHPLRRAHLAFQQVLAAPRQAAFRTALRESYSVPLPDDGEIMSLSAYRDALLGFLGFLKANINGQTPYPTEPAWANQLVSLQGFAQQTPPDRVIREEHLAEDLAALADSLGIKAPAYRAPAAGDFYDLAAIIDPKLQAAAQAAYTRDFATFGFGDWRP